MISELRNLSRDKIDEMTFKYPFVSDACFILTIKYINEQDVPLKIMTGPSVRRAAGLVTLQGKILSKIWPWSGRFLITFFSLLNYVVDSEGN